MIVWRNCVADTYYHHHQPELDTSGYEVRIDGDELVISYADDMGWVTYRGKDVGGGHYPLTAETCNGRIPGHAMMHRSPGANFLAGDWDEGGEGGMWRVHLRA